MANSGILAVGNLIIDKSLKVADYPQERMLADITDIEIHCGGGCCNLLFDLAKLDSSLPLFLSGAVGNDSNGQKLIEDARSRGVITDGISVLEGATSFTDVILNASSGDRTFFHHRGVMDDFTIEHVLALDVSAKIAHFAYIPLMQAFLQPDCEYANRACRLFDQLQQRGIKVAVDLVSLPDKQLFIDLVSPTLEFIDYLIINDEEAMLLAGNTAGEGAGYFELLAQRLLGRGVRELVIIHYPGGASAASRSGEVVSSLCYWVAPERVVSTLGAGDAFCAGALYAIHEGLTLIDTLRYGNGLAHFNLFSVSSTGGAVTRQQLSRFLTQRV